MSEEKAIVLESQQALEDTYITAGGKQYRIHGFHRDFFEQLLKLPINARIELMQLTDKQMQGYVNSKKTLLRAEVDSLLSKIWYWKDSGEEVIINIDTIPNISYTLSELKDRRRSADTLRLVIEFFTGDDREVYTKDN